MMLALILLRQKSLRCAIAHWLLPTCAL